MPKKSRIQEKIIEGIIYISGTVTTLVVLLIIFFLFKEGIGLFFHSPLEEGYAVALHPENPINELDTEQIEDIFNREIDNWQALGGPDREILRFSPNEIEEIFTKDQLGPDFKNLPSLVESYALDHPEIIVAMPDIYLSPKLRRMELKNLAFFSDFIADKEWYPTTSPVHSFGVLPIILGTLWVCAGALMFAIPAGIIASIYLAEIAHPSVRNVIMPLIELLAGIPSVIYGFFGLVVVVPVIQNSFGLSVGETALAGSILLGIIALPIIVAISEDAIRSTPRELKESSLALGANHWQTIYRVILPYSISGIVSATILGVGRTVGETMAVLMVTGNAAQIPTSFLMPVRTITATVAAELGEAPQGGLHYESLFVLACILFVITFGLNLIADQVINKSGQKKNKMNKKVTQSLVFAVFTGTTILV
ncbi:MAG: phosphate ABC transporter permease subunit PstC, partial [Bacteroidia bacterium]|nr:phosphate ABC transporter permease subunit PstC [Bacteroidia bacterium]